MSASTLKIVLGCLLVGGNLAVLVTVLCLTSVGGFTDDQQKSLLLVIGPMTAPNVVTAGRYFFTPRRTDTEPDGPPGRALFAIGCAALFPMALIAAMFSKAYNVGIREFGTLLTDVAVLEGAFGGGVALMKRHIFGLGE